MPQILIYFLTLTALYILMSWTIYLPYRIGQLHFLPVACMAVTAYLGGFAGREWGWPFVIILLLGIVVGAIIAFLPALAIGDAPCFTVVIVGVTFIFIVKTIIENWELLGGTVGFFGIPPVGHLLPLAYVIVALLGYLIYRIDHSYVGRSASVVFVNRQVAIALGINIKNLGIFYQTLSGAIAGMVGVLYGFLFGSLFPDFFAFSMVGTLMCMLFVGGYTNMWGALIAAPLLGGIPLIVPSSIASWRQIIYGSLLVLILLWRPEGLITKRMLWNLRRTFSNKFFPRQMENSTKSNS